MIFLPLPPREIVEAYLDDICASTSTAELAAAMVKHKMLPEAATSLPGLDDALAPPHGTEIRERFFGETLQAMRTAVLALPVHFPQGLPVLEHGQSDVFACKREAVLAIVCAGMLNLLKSEEAHPHQLPLRSFDDLLLGATHVAAPKLHMILCYIDKMLRPGANLAGSIYVRRVVFSGSIEETLGACELRMQPMRVVESMEAEEDCLTADFANKFVGGGVLTYGDVQEEILFAVAPEHLLATFICPVMKPNESVVITGPARFSNSVGYGRSLTFGSSYEGPQERKTLAQLGCAPTGGDDFVDGDTIAFSSVAIDALHIRKLSKCTGDAFALQLTEENILRELLKAYTGFSAQGPELAFCSGGVSTGNWGCGAFGGNRQVKALIQWIACSAASKEMRYTPFQEEDIAAALQEGREILHACAGDIRVKDLFHALLDFGRIVSSCVETGKAPPVSYHSQPFLTVLNMAIGKRRL